MDNQPPLPTRQYTYPHANTYRRAQERWPLLFRVSKGAVHSEIYIAVALHAIFTAVVVAIDTYTPGKMGLPSNIIPSLSIVVGLMLVFRNQTSYDRWWTGRNHLATVCTAVRNLTRGLLANVPPPKDAAAADAYEAETERVIRVVVAVLYSVKFTLRGEWSDDPEYPGGPPRAALIPDIPGWTPPNGTGTGTPVTSDAVGLLEASLSSTATLPTPRSLYSALLPDSLASLEHRGVPLPLQLTSFIETHIRRGMQRKWFDNPLGSNLGTQVGTLIDAFSRMEMIRSTPIPVGHLIHAKQVLALYISVLPFAMVDDMGWWAVPLVCLVSFTLYGIEGIGSQLEDPFGYDRNDLNMDGIVEDAKIEVMALLEEWKKNGGCLFT